MYSENILIFWFPTSFDETFNDRISQHGVRDKIISIIFSVFRFGRKAKYVSSAILASAPFSRWPSNEARNHKVAPYFLCCSALLTGSSASSYLPCHIQDKQIPIKKLGISGSTGLSSRVLRPFFLLPQNHHNVHQQLIDANSQEHNSD